MKTTWMVAVAAALVALPGALLGQETVQTKETVQELTKEQERDLTQTREQIRKELKLKDADLEPVQAQLREYFRLQGDGDHLRATVRFGWENGCKQECLGEMVRSMNHAMVRGMQDREARQLVCDTLRDRVRDRDRDRIRLTDSQLGDQVRVRAQERLQDWERDRERLMREFMERERQRDVDRQRDPARTHRGGG